jgi:cytochrome c-type biogenesis protein CcmE
MPPEVADALKRAGHWSPEQGPAPPAETWNTLDPTRGDRAADPTRGTRINDQRPPQPPGRTGS